MLFKNDITHAAVALQLRGGQAAIVEDVVHANHDIFFEENTEAVLLIDTENAFSSINSKVFLHNMKFPCPLISTYMCICYAEPSRLYILTGVEYYPKKGQTG